MLTVKQAADLLCVTQARVRNMIYDGILPAEKFGSNWSIPDAAVIERVALKPKRGRPKKGADKNSNATSNNAEVVHYLYQECKHNLSLGYDIDVLNQLKPPEERDFFITLADFFLQQKQKQLIDEGIF